MPLTVADVLAMPGLEIRLLTGQDGVGNRVRWAHVTELPDPVPWLRGGELVMTVGLGLPPTPEGRRGYVRRLAGAGCAALAFALDERITAVPPEVLEAAAELRLPVLEIIGVTPFIAVAEAVAQWHADERVRGERRAVAAQEAMARSALRAGPLGILRALAEHTGGETLLLDPRGRPRSACPASPSPSGTATTDVTGAVDVSATSPAAGRLPGSPVTNGRHWHAEAVAAVRDSAGTPRRAISIDRGERVLLVQSLGFSGPPRGWLALWCAGPVEWHVRVLANQAACLLALDLIGAHRTRTRAHAQRAALLAGVLDADEAAMPYAADRLAEVCPVAPPPYEVVVARPRDRAGDGPAGGVRAGRPGGDHADLAGAAIDALADVLGDPAAEELTFVCARPEGLVLVVPETTPRLGLALTERLTALTGREIAAGGCRAADLREIAPAVRHAAAVAGRAQGGYGHVDELEPWALLRDAIDPDGAGRFAEIVLRPLRDHDAQHDTALLATVRTFLDCAQNLESAARRLRVHRNTLRMRLRTAERVSGRSLSDPRHRLELWLALSLEEMVPPGRRG
ncbi:PucR family transcriptional regulator [Microtetraspora niveoalba]|uniref:PucR family transcriptional regulator n=1 Tax=Microtetraspora niveoalba TaxID=46175 RepID=UPI00082DF0EA|nr:PucR family transcriptional regulator [Microtetraspora niveoalba]